MNEIDWSQAPKWAKTVIRSGGGDGRLFWAEAFGTVSRRQRISGYKDSDTHGADMTIEGHMWTLVETRHGAWTGEGLPPVGVVCEYRVCDGPWYKCEIRYTIKHPDGGVIAYCPHLDHEQALYAPYCQFRPIRTPEQIAAELADQAIKEIAGIICRDGAFDIDDPEVTESAVALYDAGYRKP